MKKLVLLLAAAGAATVVACAPRESSPDVARWEQQAANITIIASSVVTRVSMRIIAGK